MAAVRAAQHGGGVGRPAASGSASTCSASAGRSWTRCRAARRRSTTRRSAGTTGSSASGPGMGRPPRARLPQRDAGTAAWLPTINAHFPGLGRVRANTDTAAGVTDRVTTRHDAYLEPFRARVDRGAGAPWFVMMSTAYYALAWTRSTRRRSRRSSSRRCSAVTSASAVSSISATTWPGPSRSRRSRRPLGRCSSSGQVATSRAHRRPRPAAGDVRRRPRESAEPQGVPRPGERRCAAGAARQGGPAPARVVERSLPRLASCRRRHRWQVTTGTWPTSRTGSRATANSGRRARALPPGRRPGLPVGQPDHHRPPPAGPRGRHLAGHPRPDARRSAAGPSTSIRAASTRCSASSACRRTTSPALPDYPRGITVPAIVDVPTGPGRHQRLPADHPRLLPRVARDTTAPAPRTCGRPTSSRRWRRS